MGSRDPKSFKAEDYKEAFDMFDLDKDGMISRDELARVMENFYAGTTDDEIDRIMKIADHDGDGLINFSDFSALLRDFLPQDGSEAIRQAFKLIDKDNSGRINSVKLKALLVSLGAKVTDAYVEDIIREMDLNGDGEVDFLDFLKVMKGV